MFAKYGLPETIVLDNMAIFSFSGVCQAPFKPASNGQAEKAVQTFKNGKKIMAGGLLQTKLSRFLLQNRDAPTQLLVSLQHCSCLTEN